MYLWIRFVKGSSNFFPNLGSRGQRAPNYKKGKMWKITNVLIKNRAPFYLQGMINLYLLRKKTIHQLDNENK